MGEHAKHANATDWLKPVITEREGAIAKPKES